MTQTDKSKILLIDDDTSLLVTLRDFLQFEGYEVVTAASGEEGLERLKAFTPDLIVLDLSMPGMGGMGFLDEISENGTPRYPVLVLTARAQLAEYFGSVAVQGFVSKPCDPNDLLMEISRIVFLTRGKAAGRNAAHHGRTVLVGEPDAGHVGELADRLRAAGYLVGLAPRGPEVLERAILEQPDVIVLRSSLAEAEHGTILRMLGEMSQTSSIPVIVYGAPAAGGVNEVAVAGDDATDVVVAIQDVLGGLSVERPD